MKLTKRTIEGLSYKGSGSSFYAIWDSKTPGFGVRIFPTGKKSFILKYRIRGRQRIFTIGPVGILTLDQARNKALKLAGAILDGHDPMEEKNIKGKTIRDLCSAYLEQHAKPHKKSWREDESRIRRYVIPAWSNRDVRSINRTDVEVLFNKVGKRSIYEANHLIRLLSTLFNKAIVWGYIQGNSPASGIPKFKEIKRDRWVTPQELPRLAKAIDEHSNIYIRAALWLYLLTGVRKSELLRAKWEDIDFDRKEMRLPETKAGRIHYVPLSEEAIAILRNIPEEKGNPYVFPGNREGWHLVNIDKPWRKIRKIADVMDVHLHDLRRTVGSWLAQSGNSILVIQKALNHSNIETSLIYARMSEDPVRRAMEEYGKQLMAAAGKREKGKIVSISKGQRSSR